MNWFRRRWVYCLSFFDLRLLLTPLVSSSFFLYKVWSRLKVIFSMVCIFTSISRSGMLVTTKRLIIGANIRWNIIEFSNSESLLLVKHSRLSPKQHPDFSPNIYTDNPVMLQGHAIMLNMFFPISPTIFWPDLILIRGYLVRYRNCLPFPGIWIYPVFIYFLICFGLVRVSVSSAQCGVCLWIVA